MSEGSIGATGFEPATCRRGDRSIEGRQVHRDRDLSCNSVPSRSLRPAWRTPRYELATMGHRAWLPWYLLHYAAVSALLGLRTTPHTAALSFGFALHNTQPCERGLSGRQDLNLRPVAAATAL